MGVSADACCVQVQCQRYKLGWFKLLSQRVASRLAYRATRILTLLFEVGGKYAVAVKAELSMGLGPHKDKIHGGGSRGPHVRCTLTALI